MKIIKSKKIKTVEIFKRKRNFQPDNWSVVPLKSICNLINGMAFKPSDWSEDGLEIIRIQNLNGSNIFNYYNKEDYKDRNVVLNNDLLFAWSGSIGTSFGPYLWCGKKALLNQHIFKVEMINSYDNEFYKKWFYFYLKDIEKRVEADAHGGGGLVHVKKGTMENYNISLPSIDEIENIATALSQQEDQVNKIKTLIEKLEKRNQYYAERLLSGELRVREGDDGKVEFYENTEWREIKDGNETKLIPTTWNKDSLGDLVSVTTGKKNANAGSEKGSYKFFTCSKEDKRIESYSFDQEAILIAGNGVVGLSKYYNGKFDAYQRTYILGGFKINGKYLFSFINRKFQKAIEKEIKGGVISYIKLENITDFEVLYPNSDSELKLLITSINNINLELNQAKVILEKEQKRFDWMSDALLSGEYQIVD